jgi:hypothetical protein
VWHRIDFVAELDSGGSIDVSYATTKDPATAQAVEAIFAGPDRQRTKPR